MFQNSKVPLVFQNNKVPLVFQSGEVPLVFQSGSVPLVFQTLNEETVTTVNDDQNSDDSKNKIIKAPTAGMHSRKMPQIDHPWAKAAQYIAP